MTCVAAAGLVLAAAAPALTVLGVAAAVVGVTSVAVQVLVPFAAQLARPGSRAARSAPS
ncbi:hypothetical protein ACFQV8_34720 [Pseudonocardia benzenivorans]